MRPSLATLGPVAVAASSLLASPGLADTVTLSPIKDNTLIEDPQGLVSNGAIDGIFCGRTGFFGEFSLRRGVVAFDVAGSVPAGSSITSATLTFTLLQAAPSSGTQTVTVHRLQSDWGEAGSAGFGGMGAPAQSGDATWIHTFFDTAFWTTPGGDFTAGSSASQNVGSTPESVHTFGPSAQLTADVQDMLDNPAADFGWALLGNEGANQTARRFHSREATQEAQRPMLTIEFLPPCPEDTNGDQVINVTDLVNVILDWGSDGSGNGGDTNGDQIVNVTDLVNVILAWGPC